MNHKIRVLFLDIDNTLLDFDAGAAWGMEQCFRKAGLEYRSEMFSVFTEENNKIWQRIERRELTMDDLFHVRWQAILAHLGLEADGEGIPQTASSDCDSGGRRRRTSGISI